MKHLQNNPKKLQKNKEGWRRKTSLDVYNIAITKGIKVKTDGMNWRYAQCPKHISEIQDNNLSENIFSLSPSEGCKIINLRSTNHCKTTIPNVSCSPFNYLKYMSPC